MREIVPAIMPDSFHDLTNKIEAVLGGVKTVQLDLMDGKFVPAITWPFNGMHTVSWKELMAEDIGMPYWEEIDIEYDLMINDVESFWEQLIKMAPKRIVFHFPKNQTDIDKLKNFIKNLDPYFKYEMELGIAYEHETHLNDIIELKDEISFVQCMGIERVGVQGAQLDDAVFLHIKSIKEKLPEMTITVDGAVNENTIDKFIDAGVDRFVIGSAIYNNTTPMLALQDFKKMIQ